MYHETNSNQQYIPAGTEGNESYNYAEKSAYGFQSGQQGMNYNQLVDTLASNIDDVIYAIRGVPNPNPDPVNAGGGNYQRQPSNTSRNLVWGAAALAVLALVYFAFIKK